MFPFNFWKAKGKTKHYEKLIESIFKIKYQLETNGLERKFYTIENTYDYIQNLHH